MSHIHILKWGKLRKDKWSKDALLPIRVNYRRLSTC